MADGSTVTTSKTLQTTGMLSLGARAMRLHSRPKKAQWARRQYSSDPSPSPSTDAYSAVTSQNGATATFTSRVMMDGWLRWLAARADEFEQLLGEQGGIAVSVDTDRPGRNGYAERGKLSEDGIDGGQRFHA